MVVVVVGVVGGGGGLLLVKGVRLRCCLPLAHNTLPQALKNIIDQAPCGPGCTSHCLRALCLL